MNWNLKAFDTLSVQELYAILKVRVDVFVVEQNCPYPELDDKDKLAQHLFLTNEKGEVIAYCRLLPQNVSFKEVSIGRVLVNPNFRKQDFGRELLQKALDVLNEQKERAIKIEAQYYLRNFYASFGFEECSEPFLEDGIKHVEMLRKN
ncbi:GNAT family N-acetyltransferase [Lactococcus nasutitermitis]|uniref:GNAT family N-acetyltransferase n=1 Tax=Lactococcus nasutitermitis TaxID=1652957 RepID=A0ABV9JG57_9LACT|nr:GNAT family N-acetyltransferase [Lactococcus nasutitermitis]